MFLLRFRPHFGFDHHVVAFNSRKFEGGGVGELLKRVFYVFAGETNFYVSTIFRRITTFKM